MNQSVWRQLSQEKLKGEYQYLQSVEYNDKFCFSKKGYNTSNHYFQYVRLSTKAPNAKIPMEWLKTHQDTFRNYQHTGDNQRKLTFLTKCCAQFNPTIAVQVYKKYNATCVFDPFAGWGDRCVSAMACGIQYIGCDTNSRLQEPYQQLIQAYPCNHQPIIHCPMDSSNVPIPDEVDLVFSSPPYFNAKQKLMEHYNGCEQNYHKFMTHVLLPLRQRTHARIVLHLPPNMYEDIKTHWGDANEIIQFTKWDTLYVW